MKRMRQTPSFFWQGLLIILPVAVLALVGFISLREDEQTAETDARNRAAASAQSLARAMRASVNEELHRFLTLDNTWMLGLFTASQPSVSGPPPEAGLQADMERWEKDYPDLQFKELALPPAELLADGRPIQPPELSAAPQPPKWFRDLTPEQAKLWATLRTGGRKQEMETWRDNFLGSGPSAEARNAVVDLLQPPEQMIGHSNFLPSETGISFEEIALYRLLTATNAQLTPVLFQSIWWHAIEHPSMVAAKLLELAGGLTNRANLVCQQKFAWAQAYFAGQSKARECLDSLRRPQDLQPWKTSCWSHWTGNRAALAVFEPTTYGNFGNDFEGRPLEGQGYKIWLVPRPVALAIFDRAFAENKSLVPAYAAAAVTVEGIRLVPRDPPAAIDEKSLLGDAEQKAGSYFAQDAIGFDVKFYLASREQMLAAERQRAKLFGTLILVAAVTALTGLFSARRAFRRQLQLNEQKSNFVSSVSHELRAPIASVRLMAENLERGKVPEPARQGEYFRYIVQECRRLSSLIENVLDFSRIEQGRKQYEFEPTNLAALAETTVKLMEPYAAEKGVLLKLETFNLQPSTPNIELNVDGRAIQQALVNLIDNAVKHSPKGETVLVGIENGAAGMVGLYVADQGPGIPPAEHEKIFERFYRLGSELRRETQGVGIGLSVVKHIVEAHDGRVCVQSAMGHGSRFTIEFPAK